MGLGALFERIAQAIDAAYERRIRAASNVTEYGAGHSHTHDPEPVVGASPELAHHGEPDGDTGYTPAAEPEPDVVPPVHS